MKRILITINNLTIGGSQMALINLLNELDYKKYQVDLVLFEEKGTFLSSIPSSVNVISITKKYNLKMSKIKRLFIEFFRGENYFKKLYNDLKSSKKYDMALAFDGYVSFVDYYAAFANASKRIIWVHSDYLKRRQMQPLFNFRLLSMKKKYRYFDTIVAVSKSAMENFIKIFPCYHRKLTYLWNLVNVSKIDKGKNEPSDITLDKNTFNIVAVGSVRKVKGFDRLLEVQKKLINNGYRTKVYIIGDGPDLKKLEKIRNHYHLEDNFIFLGKKANPYNILKQANLFVLSSYYEGFGIVLLESLYCGVPILVPKISGANEIAKFIAPQDSSITTENSIEGIYQGIISAVEKPLPPFKFDAIDYNNKIINKIKDLLS